MEIFSKEYQTWQEIVKLRINLRDIHLDYWLNYNLFSFSWWLALIITIIPYIIWWKKVNKAQLMEILSYGLFVAIISTILDIIGTSLVLWGYPIRLFPIIQPLLMINLSVLPVTFMLIYQYFPKWKPFLLANTLTFAVYSFIFEPIFRMLNIYEINNWKHTYSFLIYICMALFLKWLLEKIKFVSKST